MVSKRGSVVVGQAGWRCGAVVRGRECEAADRAGGIESESAGPAGLGLAPITDSIFELQNETKG